MTMTTNSLFLVYLFDFPSMFVFFKRLLRLRMLLTSDSSESYLIYSCLQTLIITSYYFLSYKEILSNYVYKRFQRLHSIETMVS